MAAQSPTTTTPNNREARRRKIVERGSDRLALITGRIHNLPSSPSGSGSSPLSHYPSPFSPNSKDEVFGSMLQKLEKIADASQKLGEDYSARSRTESSLSESGTEIKESKALPSSEISGEASKLHASESRGRVLSSPANGTTEQSVEPRVNQQGTLTSNQIISAISATETLRLYCSVAFALLVVLSQIGFPILGCNFIKNIIGFRPLYLLLLTNLTIVVSRLLLENGGALRLSIMKRSMNPASDNNGWTDHIGKALEIGLVLQKSFDAAYTDCCVYAVIVVCGLFLA
ncbi:hypothetical protein ACFE04_016329 [Oxalis oulophora]